MTTHCHPERSIALFAALGLMSCSSFDYGANAPPLRMTTNGRASHRMTNAGGNASPGKYIEHVVVLIQENRSFDNLFATFPGANGTTQGTMHNGKVVPLVKRPLTANDIGHTYPLYLTAYDNGKMDGFDLETQGGGRLVGKYPYQYVDPAQIGPYWTMA